MKNKQKNKSLFYMLLALLLLVVTVMSGGLIAPAFADTHGYTSAIDDLQKDKSFNIAVYPVDNDDYKIQVIQIAESVDGELFVYTYQPCQMTKQLEATQINMSLTDKLGGIVENDTTLTDKDKPQLFNLTLISVSGVFCKHKVNDFDISSDAVRYYNISSIYRKYAYELDGAPGNGQATTAKYFPVGKCFKAETADGSIKYSCKDIETIEIKNPFVDFLSYYKGVTWGSMFGLTGDEFTDVHYIAFSTDRKIDTLKEADITYTTQSYQINAFKDDVWGEKSDPQYLTLTGEMDISAYKYTWACIQRSEDFIKSTDLNKTTADTVKQSEFVLVFLTTPYIRKSVSSLMQGHGYNYSGTKVSDVSILRLMFETDGVTYNLGALMGQMEADEKPGNGYEPEQSIDFWAYIWRCIVRLFNGTATLSEQIVAVITLFLCVLVLPILLTVLSLIFPAFGAVMKMILTGIITAVKYLFISLWYIVSAPFRFIVWLVRKCRGE